MSGGISQPVINFPPPFVIPQLQSRIKWDGNNELGSGSFGTVYKCELDGETVAVKRITYQDDAESKVRKENIDKVVKLWSSFDSDYITKFKEVHMDVDSAYIFMEHAEQGSLNELITKYTFDEDKGLPIKYLFGWSEDILKGLDYLHSRDNPLIHRDMKSNNILIDAQNRAKLADFDFLRLVNPVSTSVVSSGGAPAYTAPELLNPKVDKVLLPRSDLFSFSFILWEMVACASPEDVIDCNVSTMSFVVQIHIYGWRPPRPWHCPLSMWQIIEHCWQKRPDDRPESAKWIMEQLIETKEKIMTQFDIEDDDLSLQEIECLQEDIPAYYDEEAARNRYNQITNTRIVGKEKGDAGTGNGEFNMPYDITKSKNGDIYVVDSENRRVQVFTMEGDYHHHIGEIGILQWPKGVTITRSGNIAVLDGIIKLFSPDGHLIRSFSKTGSGREDCRYPWRIASDSKGRIFLSDGGNGRIQVFDENGTYITQLGQKGDNMEQFANPSYLTVDNNDHLLAVDGVLHRILRFDDDCRYYEEIEGNGKGDSELIAPQAIAVDNDGSILIIDGIAAQGKYGRVFTPEFKPISNFGLGILESPIGITALPNNTVATVDFERQQMLIFG